METFKGVDTEGLINAIGVVSGYRNREYTINSIANYLGNENAYDRHKKLCLQKVLRETGIVLSEVEAVVVMECFTTNDYTRQNILLTKQAFQRLSAIGKENEIEEYRKFFLDYKEELKKKNSPEPLILVLDELANISSFVNYYDLTSVGIATTLDKARNGKVRYAQMVIDELDRDIEYLIENCEMVLNNADSNDYVYVYYMINNAVGELASYKELLDEEPEIGDIRLEGKLIERVIDSLNQVSEKFRSSFVKAEDVQSEGFVDNAKKCMEEAENLKYKLEHQWRTFSVHYQDILVYHSVEYVIKNNPYAKRLMDALKKTDEAFQKLTGQSLLQVKILQVEDKYRPVVGYDGKKRLRVPVQSGEDE